MQTSPWIAAAIALVALLIAYRQARTAHDRLRLDLFEKRLEVYDGVGKLLAELTSQNDIDGEIIFGSWKYWRSARFLFKSEVADCIEEIIKFAGKIQVANKMLEVEQQQEKREKYAKITSQRHEQLEKFRERFDELIMPYMKFSETGLGGFKRSWPYKNFG